MVVVWLSFWCNDLGSGEKNGGEDIESVAVDVEYAMESKEMDLLRGLEKGHIKIEAFSYVLQSYTATRVDFSATNPADLSNRSAPRRTVECRLEHEKSGQHFFCLFSKFKGSDGRENLESKQIALL